MPTYDFKCPDCGTTFEKFLRRMDDPAPACPNCGKSHVERQVSAGQFRLAGGGWYETDFKSGSDKKRNLAGDGGSSGGGASG